jgi:hypothetical protein
MLLAAQLTMYSAQLLHATHSAQFTKRNYESTASNSQNKAQKAQRTMQSNQSDCKPQALSSRRPQHQRRPPFTTRKPAKSVCVRATQHRNGNRGRKKTIEHAAKRLLTASYTLLLRYRRRGWLLADRTLRHALMRLCTAPSPVLALPTQKLQHQPPHAILTVLSRHFPAFPVVLLLPPTCVQASAGKTTSRCNHGG